MPLPLAVAVSVFVPSWTVQLPTVATPSTPVVAFAPVTLPPPLDTAKVTATLGTGRSEEHTSELQSRPHLVCRLLLEKKKLTRPASQFLECLCVFLSRALTISA